jgi:hypothetical protein
LSVKFLLKGGEGDKLMLSGGKSFEGRNLPKIIERDNQTLKILLPGTAKWRGGVER